MSDQTNRISIIALIGAVLALLITVVLNLCPACAEKKLNVSAKDETTKLSEELANQSLRLSQIERTVSQLETQGGSVPAPVGNQATFEPYVWTQLYPDAMLQKGKWKTLGSGDMIARAIVAAGQACPKIVVNGRSVFLVPRSIIYPTSFPVTLCETAQPFSGNSQVAFGLKSFRPWTSEPKHILVIGDTGCRVTYYPTPQNCEDRAGSDKGWLFPIIADLAGKVSDIDLVIHVGDYHYRERPCPAGDQSLCGSTDWGYNWDSWQADFFEPARYLLAHAPWIFVRGNHETCNRAGTGWTNFLWPTLYDKGFKFCQDYHEPYVLKLADGLSLAVLDIANAESSDYYDDDGKKERADLYSDWMKVLSTANLEESVWIAMQQPPWQWPTTDKQQHETAAVRDETVKQIQKYLRAPNTADSEQPFKLVLAGDTHVFQALRPENGGQFPWVVISGMGGTKLDDKDYFQVDSRDIFSAEGGSILLDAEIVKDLQDKPKRQSVTAFGWHGFGYTILEKQASGSWWAKVHDETGKEAYNCKLIENGNCAVSKSSD